MADNIIKPEFTEIPIKIERENAIIRKLAPGAVASVNGKTGDVVLTAEDVGAPATTDMAAVAFSGQYDDLEGEPQSFSYDDWELLWQ